MNEAFYAAFSTTCTSPVSRKRTSQTCHRSSTRTLILWSSSRLLALWFVSIACVRKCWRTRRKSSTGCARSTCTRRPRAHSRYRSRQSCARCSTPLHATMQHLFNGLAAHSRPHSFPNEEIVSNLEIVFSSLISLDNLAIPLLEI